MTSATIIIIMTTGITIIMTTVTMIIMRQTATITIVTFRLYLISNGSDGIRSV